MCFGPSPTVGGFSTNPSSKKDAPCHTHTVPYHTDGGTQASTDTAVAVDPTAAVRSLAAPCVVLALSPAIGSPSSTLFLSFLSIKHAASTPVASDALALPLLLLCRAARLAPQILASAAAVALPCLGDSRSEAFCSDSRCQASALTVLASDNSICTQSPRIDANESTLLTQTRQKSAINATLVTLWSRVAACLCHRLLTDESCRAHRWSAGASPPSATIHRLEQSPAKRQPGPACQPADFGATARATMRYRPPSSILSMRWPPCTCRPTMDLASRQPSDGMPSPKQKNVRRTYSVGIRTYEGSVWGYRNGILFRVVGRLLRTSSPIQPGVLRTRTRPNSSQTACSRLRHSRSQRTAHRPHETSRRGTPEHRENTSLIKACRLRGTHNPAADPPAD